MMYCNIISVNMSYIFRLGLNRLLTTSSDDILTTLVAFHSWKKKMALLCIGLFARYIRQCLHICR